MKSDKQKASILKAFPNISPERLKKILGAIEINMVEIGSPVIKKGDLNLVVTEKGKFIKSELITFLK